MTSLLFFIASDAIWFSVVQIALALLTVWAFLKVNLLVEDSPVDGVFRGDQSRELLLSTATLVLTVVVSVLVTISTFPSDGKVLIYLINVTEIAYLAMWNGWSTNKLIGFVGQFRNRNFNPHH